MNSPGWTSQTFKYIASKRKTSPLMAQKHRFTTDQFGFATYPVVMSASKSLDFVRRIPLQNY